MIIKLLGSIDGDLVVASKDRCSEIARLVGCWILDEYPEYKAQICKGEFADGTAHDILAVDDGEKLFLIDPTIWQKFPESESILIGSVENIQEAFDVISQKYGGVWKISEGVNQHDDNDKNNLTQFMRNV